MTVKYMGSKRAMLKNGLGELLKREMPGRNRFVDLFTGSGSVAIHVARHFDIPVQAYDLQNYSVVVANAIINRQSSFDWKSTWKRWYEESEIEFVNFNIPSETKITQAIVAEFREWCGSQKMPITRAYGGHYFSPTQAVWIDVLRQNIPKEEPARTIALAALIQSSSHCVASPGHTAQPFQPTSTAKKYLAKAWGFSFVERTKILFEELSNQFAIRKGNAIVADANNVAADLQSSDLAFIDTPYSGEHYSRFYHVLETVAVGQCGEVSGVGRYPSQNLRPKSNFSLRTQSVGALDGLLETVSRRGAKAILTFPDHDCSNGLSGQFVREVASEYFIVEEKVVKSDFSTLGGTGTSGDDLAGREARQVAEELILILNPK